VNRVEQVENGISGTKDIQMEHARYLGHHEKTNPTNHGKERRYKIKALTTYSLE
jgi:hypothetical protein